MKSILIVEDDITYGMMLKTWLGKKGFQVASVSSIARAQKHLEAEGADLIVRPASARQGRHRPVEVVGRARSVHSAHHDDKLCRYTIGGASYEIRCQRLRCQACKSGRTSKENK